MLLGKDKLFLDLLKCLYLLFELIAARNEWDTGGLWNVFLKAQSQSIGQVKSSR